MDFTPIIEKNRRRFAELESAISVPGFFDNPANARDITREHSRLKTQIAEWDALARLARQLEDNRELATSNDPDLAELAAAEIPDLEQKVAEAEQTIRISLLPPNPNDDRDAIVEIRAGAGGAEAALFAADLHRMYSRWAESAGLSMESLESSPSELGGLKEAIFKLTGSNVFQRLKFESGVHRVQRVPATEAQGRIHTSTATVAVLPEAEEVDLELKPDEIRIEVCRAGGPGGQGVNTTDSAVQVLHIPTGMIVRCQDGRSQQKNKDKALKILRSRLLEAKQREEAEKYAAQRKSQVGTGERNEKIRTYNFPQNRITDHRIGLTLYNLDRVIEGELDPMIQALQAEELKSRLEAAGL
jgi:peptide chain release factor 1